jgi:hypothetical protein
MSCTVATSTLRPATRACVYGHQPATASMTAFRSAELNLSISAYLLIEAIMVSPGGSSSSAVSVQMGVWLTQLMLLLSLLSSLSHPRGSGSLLVPPFFVTTTSFSSQTNRLWLGWTRSGSPTKRMPPTWPRFLLYGDSRPCIRAVRRWSGTRPNVPLRMPVSPGSSSRS